MKKKYRNWHTLQEPLPDSKLEEFAKDGWMLEHFQVVSTALNTVRFYYIFVKEI